MGNYRIWSRDVCKQFPFVIGYSAAATDFEPHRTHTGNRGHYSISTGLENERDIRYSNIDSNLQCLASQRQGHYSPDHEVLLFDTKNQKRSTIGIGATRETAHFRTAGTLLYTHTHSHTIFITFEFFFFSFFSFIQRLRSKEYEHYWNANRVEIRFENVEQISTTVVSVAKVGVGFLSLTFTLKLL
jgi:hypothetical protein